MTELRIALQPKQKLFAKAIEETPVTFYGGAKGGGKSGGLRRILLLRRFKYPKSHGVIFRRTYPELEGNHIRKLFEEFPQLAPYYKATEKILELPNGSTLQFCHCQNENDITLYQGREFHDLAIDEAGQWPESMYATLRGSNRSSTPGIPARTILTGNPGGIGHGWLKRIFVERRFNERERPEDYAFVQALVADNAALIENDPDYVQRLKAEPNEALRRAYLFGDWDIHAGQYFGEIRREVHLIKPFKIPEHWLRAGAYDYGYGHPGSFGWYAMDQDGNVYKYREFVQAKLDVDQFADAVLKFEDTRRLEYIVAGLDCWVDKRTGMTGKNVAPTIAEKWLAKGIALSKASIGRKQGAAHMQQYLSWQRKPNKQPAFFMFDTCPITFDTLTRMEHDPDDLEDVLKVDATEGDPMTGDDAYDETRYFLMSRPPLSDEAPLVGHAKEVKAMEEYAENQLRIQKDIEAGIRFEDDPWAKDIGGFSDDFL